MKSTIPEKLSKSWDPEKYHNKSQHQFNLALQSLKHLSFTGTEKVIDVGCGSGNLTELIAKTLLPQGSIIGVDLSEKMIAFAQKNYADVPNCTFTHADACNLPYANEFDVLVSFYCLHWIQEMQEAINNFYTCLKPGGRALVAMGARMESELMLVEGELMQTDKWAPHFEGVQTPWNSQTPQAIVEMFGNAGFRNIRSLTERIKVSFNAKAELRDWFNAVPRAPHLSKELKSEFDADFVEAFLRKSNQENSDTIVVTLEALVILAEK